MNFFVDDCCWWVFGDDSICFSCLNLKFFFDGILFFLNCYFGIWVREIFY